MQPLLKVPLTLIAFCTALGAQAPGRGGPLPKDRANGAISIDQKELRSWLTTLSSDEFGGRGTGQEGFRKAARFMRSHFEHLGLEPAGDRDDYWQVVPWKRTSPEMQQTRIEVLNGTHVLVSIRAADGLRGSALSNSEQRGKLVLVRYADVNKLDQVDLKGKLVLVAAPDGLIEGRGRRAQFQARRALTQVSQVIEGSGGLLLAVAADDYYEAVGPMVASSHPVGGQSRRAGRGRRAQSQQLLIDSKSLDSILKAAHLDRDAISRAAGPVISLRNLKARCRVVIETTDAPAFNVLGILRGSDPLLRDEFVGIGCHLDHLGTRGGTIYPGADDDGSGSAALMAIAQAFVRNPIRPKRSILFMAFCGEELGLRGSGYLAAHPPFPLEQLVAEIQVDMIGRNEEHDGEKASDNLNSLHLVGSAKLSRDLNAICTRLNEDRAGFDLEYDEEDVFYRSDHWNFAKEGVPIAFLFTGFHPDYHRPTDTVDKINFPKLARVATYVYDMAFELADQDARPMVDEDLWNQLERKGREQPAAPLRKKD